MSRAKDIENRHAKALENKHKAEALREAAEAAKIDAVGVLKATWGIDTLEDAKALLAQKHTALEAILAEAEERLKDA